VTQLTPHFTTEEMLVTASELPNYAPPDAISCLRALCSAVLEPLRERVGALKVTSGFRSQDVNAELRKRGYTASKTSQHLRGEAADIVPVHPQLHQAWSELVRLTEAGLPVDQGIVYVRPLGRGWLHISHTARTLARRELLVDLGGGRPPVTWASYRGPLVAG
jgi:zinc D-Ala-D-Ala carboxypeptidase